jgi:hypothetical protein
MISAIISSMDRTERLIKMLPTWAEIEKIKDIVVVDWSSKTPVIEDEEIKNILTKYNKIKIIRVENQDYFHLPKSYNLGYLFTDKSNKILLKLDADYVSINSAWIDCLRIDENQLILKKYFICGLFRFCKSSSGFLLINKKDFENAKGYNQNLAPAWGFDDQDIQERIMKLYEPNDSKFLFHKIFFWNFQHFIYHIPHDNEFRYKNYPIKKLDSSVNRIIAKKETKWEFPKFKILESNGNYIRVNLIENLK